PNSELGSDRTRNAGWLPAHGRIPVAPGRHRGAILLDVSLFFEQRTSAQVILGVTAVVAVVAESWATYAGDGSVDGSRWRRAARSASATVLVRNRRAGATSDKGTKRILIGGTILGLLAMIWLTQ